MEEYVAKSDVLNWIAEEKSFYKTLEWCGNDSISESSRARLELLEGLLRVVDKLPTIQVEKGYCPYQE